MELYPLAIRVKTFPDHCLFASANYENERFRPIWLEKLLKRKHEKNYDSPQEQKIMKRLGRVE